MKAIFLFLVGILAINAAFCSSPPKKKKNTNTTRIINGADVTLSYQALLSTDPTNLCGAYHGGGVLITPKCILTAKHVITDGTNNLKAYVGIGNRNQATQPLAIAKKITNNNVDLGIIFLTNAVPDVNGTDPSIKLTSEQNSTWWSPNQTLEVSGFGVASTNTTCVSNTCKRTPVSTNSTILSDMIVCQGPSTNDACQGDSGGPLVRAFGNSANNVLTGIVSTDLFGSLPAPSNGAKNNCGLGGRYVKVSKFLDWIVEQIFFQNAPDFICATPTTITTLPYMPDGCSMSWTTQVDSGYPSGLFSTTSGSGLSFTVAAGNSSVMGFGTITLTFTYPNENGTVSVKSFAKKVWVGPPSPVSVVTDGTFQFTGAQASICRNFGYCMTVSNPQSSYGTPAQVVYSVSHYTYSGSFPNANGSNAFFSKSTTSVADDRVCFGSNVATNYTINVVANNPCGFNSRTYFITVNNCGYRVFPNPAKNTVQIVFENPDQPESIPNTIELYDEKTQEKVKALDLSKSKKSSVEMDVSELPRGTYYLKLAFDKKSEVETIRLILE